MREGEKWCSPHECRDGRAPCYNFRDAKSKGLCATCFNHGCVADKTADHPAHIVAGNAATAIIGEGAGDTTRVDEQPWRVAYEKAHGVISDLCHGRRRWTMSIPAREDSDPDLVLGGTLRLLATEIENRDADLLRLAGPPCDYPPCKGARAVEHQRCRWVGTIGCPLNYVHDMCSPRHHLERGYTIADNDSENETAMADRDRHIAELTHVAGPVMPCGCYAVEMSPHGALPDRVCCDRHKVIHEATPAYTAWKESR